jgi:hypothetical protein
MHMQGEQLNRGHLKDAGDAVKLGTCGVTADMMERQRMSHDARRGTEIITIRRRRRRGSPKKRGHFWMKDNDNATKRDAMRLKHNHQEQGIYTIMVGTT